VNARQDRRGNKRLVRQGHHVKVGRNSNVQPMVQEIHAQEHRAHQVVNTPADHDKDLIQNAMTAIAAIIAVVDMVVIRVNVLVAAESHSHQNHHSTMPLVDWPD
jgi:hypothetical protein